MKTFNSFSAVDNFISSREDNTIASDETLNHFEQLEAKATQMDMFADLEVAYRIRLSRLSREIRSLARLKGKKHPMVKAAWKHFFEVRDGLTDNGNLGQTKLTPKAIAAMRKRNIHRASSISLAMKMGETVAKAAKVARVYHHPTYHEFWVFPKNERPKDESGLIATLRWNGRGIICNDDAEYNAMNFVAQQQKAERLPFTITFCKDAHIAETYGELTIHAYTANGAETIFRERFPHLHLIDTMHQESVAEDLQNGVDEFNRNDRDATGGYASEEHADEEDAWEMVA